MSKQVIKKLNQATIQPCDKLLREFFFETLKTQKGLDKQIVKILERLYGEGQLTADNIIRALREERTKSHEQNIDQRNNP